MTYLVSRPRPDWAELGRNAFEKSLTHRAIALLEEEGAPLYRKPETNGEWAYNEDEIALARTRVEYAPQLSAPIVTVADRLDIRVEAKTAGDFAVRVVEHDRDTEPDYESMVAAIDRENFLYENVDSDTEVYVKVRGEWTQQIVARKDFTYAPERNTITRSFRKDGLDCDEFHWRKTGQTVRKFGPIVIEDLEDGDVSFRCYGTNNSGCYRGGSFAGWILGIASERDYSGWDVILGYASLRSEFGAMILSHADRCKGRARY